MKPAPRLHRTRRRVLIIAAQSEPPPATVGIDNDTPQSLPPSGDPSIRQDGFRTSACHLLTYCTLVQATYDGVPKWGAFALMCVPLALTGSGLGYPDRFLFGGGHAHQRSAKNRPYSIRSKKHLLITAASSPPFRKVRMCCAPTCRMYLKTGRYLRPLIASLSMVLQYVVLLLITFCLWKVWRWSFSPSSPLDNIHGPPSPSWIAGWFSPCSIV